MVPVSTGPGGSACLQGRALSCLLLYLLGPGPALAPSSHNVVTTKASPEPPSFIQYVLCAWGGERSPQRPLRLTLLWLQSIQDPFPLLPVLRRQKATATFPSQAPSRVWVPAVSGAGPLTWDSEGGREPEAALPCFGCSLQTGRVMQTCVFSCTGVLGAVALSAAAAEALPALWLTALSLQMPQVPEAPGEQILSSLSLPSSPPPSSRPHPLPST